MTCSPHKLLSRSQRHAVILQGAATAFVTKGFASTAMEEVAAASGITKEIVYRHFASKEELYRAVLDAAMQSIKAEFARARQRAQSGAGIRALLAVGRAHPTPCVFSWCTRPANPSLLTMRTTFAAA